WSLGSTRYYLGRVPNVFRTARLSEQPRQGSDAWRALIRVDSAWHMASIRLAGRIWGDLCRNLRNPSTQ
ncbi:hypothetical protein DL93DRAFT_2069219, partial [Clavulina sp. PMI_390]